MVTVWASSFQREASTAGLAFWAYQESGGSSISSRIRRSSSPRSSFACFLQVAMWAACFAFQTQGTPRCSSQIRSHSFTASACGPVGSLRARPPARV